MIAKNCDAAVPTPGAFSREDDALLAAADALAERSRAAMAEQQIHQMLSAVWQVVADANRYFAAQEPWALRKTDPSRMATVLYVTAEAVRQIAILVQAVMPRSAGRLLDQLAAPSNARTFADLGPGGRLAAGTPLPSPQPVFPRYVEAEKA
jgi:methionyl-tRNA synthetase